MSVYGLDLHSGSVNFLIVRVLGAGLRHGCYGWFNEPGSRSNAIQYHGHLAPRPAFLQVISLVMGWTNSYFQHASGLCQREFGTALLPDAG